MKEQIGLTEIQALKKGLVELMSHIQKIKKEIALIKKPGDHFNEISDELDAVIESTEQATSDIMENSENIEDLVNDLKKQIKDPAVNDTLDKICENTSNIIVSCSFQDITGQRVTKVIRAMQYVEERINSLIATWGEEEIQKTKIEPPKEEVDEYKKYLHGPALKGQGVSQDEVDAMLKGQKNENKPKPSTEPKAAKPVIKTNKDAEPKASINQNDIDALFD